MTALALAEELAGRLGLRKRPRSWGGDCPSCGYHAAFAIRLSPKFARPLLYCANGCSREQLAAVAAGALGEGYSPAPRSTDADVVRARDRKQAAAARLWDGSAAITGDDCAGVYLRLRGLRHLIGSTVLRYRPDCPHPEGGRPPPAMMALVQDVGGRSIGVHRTYLGTDGRKAACSPVARQLRWPVRDTSRWPVRVAIKRSLGRSSPA